MRVRSLTKARNRQTIHLRSSERDDVRVCNLDLCEMGVEIGGDNITEERRPGIPRPEGDHKAKPREVEHSAIDVEMFKAGRDLALLLTGLISGAFQRVVMSKPMVIGDVR